MKGYVSFHPIDLAFFDALIAPLVLGRKVNPEEFLQRAPILRRNGWAARRFAVAIAELAAGAEAPTADPAASPWRRLRANLERIDFRPDAMASKAARGFDPELHLDGRPFFIVENSTEKVVSQVEAYAAAESESAVERIARSQVALLDAELARAVEPAEIAELSSDLGYRSDLLSLLTKIYELARLAREGRDWVDPDAAPRSAADALCDELPWRALSMHAKVTPFWIAREVDGLRSVSASQGVARPRAETTSGRGRFRGARRDRPAPPVPHRAGGADHRRGDTRG
jgi:hypothetical protein